MDEEIKLSPKQLLRLLSALKGSKKDAPPDPDALLRSQLTDEQFRAAQQVLHDPQRLQALLQHPQIRALLQQLRAEANDHGADGV